MLQLIKAASGKFDGDVKSVGPMGMSKEVLRNIKVDHLVGFQKRFPLIRFPDKRMKETLF